MATDASTSFKGYEQNIIVSSTPVSLFDNPNIPGHYFIRLISSSTLYAALEIRIYTDINSVLVANCFAIDAFGASQKGQLPISFVGLSPYDFNTFTIDFQSNQLLLSVDSGTINTLATSLVLPVGYTGSTSFKCNEIYENKTSAGITFNNQTYFLSGLAATGPISLGDDSSPNNILIGTAGSKSITIGNNNSTLQLNGDVTIANNTGTIIMSSLPNSSWSNMTGSAIMAGNSAFVSVQATLNSTGSFNAFTPYDLCNIQSTVNSFNPSNIVIGSLLISAAGNSQIGIVSSTGAVSGYNIQFQVPSLLNTTPATFNTSLSYIA